MFEYLAPGLKKLIEKLSPEEIIECVESEKFDFIKPIIAAEPVRFWPDLCKYHFDIEPLPNQNAVDVFYGEYYFKGGDLLRAADYGSFNALFKLNQNAVGAKQNAIAIQYGEKAAELYNAPGHIVW